MCALCYDGVFIQINMKYFFFFYPESHSVSQTGTYSMLISMYRSVIIVAGSTVTELTWTLT